MPEETTEKPFDPGAVLKEQVGERFRRQIDELKAKIAGLERELKERMEADATIRVVLSGDGGGTWFVNFAGGEAKVEAKAASAPILSVHQSLGDFRTAVTTTGGFGMGLGGGGNQDLTKSRVARLKGVKGTLQFKVTDLPDGKEMPVTVHFGEGEPVSPPQAVISVKAEDALKLRSGQMNPQMAFMQGMIKLQGDAALAMAVGMAMM